MARAGFPSVPVSTEQTFASVWGKVVKDLRKADLISDAEKNHLMMHRADDSFVWLEATLSARPTTSEPVPTSPNSDTEGWQPLMFPSFIHVGVLQRVVDGSGWGADSQQTLLTMRQLRGWGLLLSVGLDFITAEEARALQALGSSWPAVPDSFDRLDGRQKQLKKAKELIAEIDHVYNVKDEDEDKGVAALRQAAPGIMEKFAELAKGLQDEVDHALELHCAVDPRSDASDKLRKHQAVLAGARERIEGGAGRPDVRLPIFRPPKQLLQHLKAMLGLGADDASPKSKDARWTITTFLNSLAMNR